MSITAFIFQGRRRALLALCLVIPAFGLFAQAPAPQRPRVALVLQGGGAMGIAHLGVLKQIEELGIPVDIVVGTSMGSIVGGLYSIGYSEADLEKIILGADWLSLFFENARHEDEKFWDRMDRSRYFASLDFDRHGIKLASGLLSDQKILTYFDRLNLVVPTPVNFDAFPRQFRAVATDVATGERVVMAGGSLSDAMRASMSIPGVFSPYSLDGRYLIDGGIVDNLPIDVARELGADIIIAIQLTGGTPFSAEELNRSPLTSLSRSLDILVDANVRKQLPNASYVLNINLTGFDATDFLRGKEILEIGEKAAREHKADFEALKKRILDQGGAKASPGKRVSSPIATVAVEGATKKAQARLLARLKPLEGSAPDDAALGILVEELEEQGIYRSIRLLRTSRDGEEALVLKVEKRPPEKHVIRLGFSSATTWGQSLVSREIISPGIVLRDLPFQGSKLAIGCSMMDRPGLELDFLQPIGSNLFAELTSGIATDTNLYVTDTAENYLTRTTLGSNAVRFGLTLFNSVEIATGLRMDSLPAENTYPNIPAGDALGSVALVTASFKMLLLDSFIFPQSGLYLETRYLQGLPGYQDSREFETLETSGCLVPPLNIPLSFELEWKYGTDFTQWGSETGAAPAFYKPDLNNRRMFPDLQNINEKAGSHVWGVSLLGKYQLNWARRALGMPTFMLLHGATGTTLQNYEQVRTIKDHSFWVADVGLGMRFNDAFGLMIRVGSSCNHAGTTNGFVAIDMGSFGIR